VPKPIYVIGHRNPDTDSIGAAIAYAQFKNLQGESHVRPARAGELNAESRFVLEHFHVPAPELLTDATGLDLILVDHSEIGQALPNIEQARVHEILEHHRMGDLRTPEPILIHCEPVGATATLVAERYFSSGLTPSPAMAGLMIAAILSDTVGFRSPTTSDKDRDVAARLAPLAGLDLEDFDRRLREIRTQATASLSAAAILGSDFKEFHMGELRLGIGQVEVMGADALAHRKQDILTEMREVLEARGLALVILMVTDIDAQASDLWVVGDRLDVAEQAFGPIRQGRVHLPGCLSRKKQVVPPLEEVLARRGA